MLPENVGETIDHKLVFGQKLRISFPRLVSDWLDDFDIKLRITGDKFPKSLAAKLDVVSFVLAFPWLFPVATTVDTLCFKAALVLGINFPRLVKRGSQLFNLLAVGPVRAGFYGNEILRFVADKFEVQAIYRRLVPSVGFAADINRQILQKRAEKSFFRGGKISIQDCFNQVTRRSQSLSSEQIGIFSRENFEQF